MRFTPNASARSLSLRSASAFGVVLPDLHGQFFSELLRGIDRTAQRHGRHLLVSSSHHDSRGIAPALRAMHGRVDGLILMTPDIPASELASALPHGLATVMINCAATEADAKLLPDCVQVLTVDNFGGAVSMVRHLAKIGHRRIAFIDGVAHNEDARERRRGYLAAMHELGLEAPAGYQPRGDFSEEGGWRATQKLLAESRVPTAIFAANDMMALGVLVALREHGKRVPEDIAVVGFDDIPTARHVSPPLTTISVDVNALGERAASLLLNATTEHRAKTRAAMLGTHREVLATTLVIRASCGAGVSGISPASPSGTGRKKKAVVSKLSINAGSRTRDGSKRNASDVLHAPECAENTAAAQFVSPRTPPGPQVQARHLQESIA